MKILDLVETLPANLVFGAPGYRDLELGNILAGDIMSDVLVTVESETILVTSLATDQAVRTADLVGVSAILLVNDKLPPASMKKLAEECGITLLATPIPMFETCVTLGYLGSMHEKND